MKRPVILLTPQYNAEYTSMTSPKRYTDRMTEHGALPLLAPCVSDPDTVEQLADMADGVLFTGGDDVDPEIYGWQKEPECGFITRYRDDYEIALLNAVMKRKKPVLGICRGIQLLNVGLGGTLIQHRDGHRNVIHGVNIEKGSRLYNLLGEDTIKTNSFHHQAVEIPFSGASITAYAEDGTIEAIEMDDYPFFLGVQWHPEVISGEECDRMSKIILGAFVEACK